MSEVRNVTITPEERHHIDYMLPKFKNNLSLLVRVAVKQLYNEMIQINTNEKYQRTQEATPEEQEQIKRFQERLREQHLKDEELEREELADRIMSAKPIRPENQPRNEWR